MVDAAHELPKDDGRPDPATGQDAQPNWLVSSDRIAEEARQAEEEGAQPEGLRLTTSRELAAAVPVERPKIPVRPDPAESRKPEKPPGPVAWSAAASSVPKLKLDASTPAASGAAAAVAPMRVVAPQMEEVRQARGPARLSSAPEISRRAEAPPAFGDESGDDAAAGDDFTAFPDDTGPTGPVRIARPAPKLEEPFWVIALDALRSNSRVQLIVAAVVVVPLVAWIVWPRSEPGISLSALRREPMRWDGQVVRLKGRVGDVFHVGAGWAFNLHQGRDTIVVFTRGTAPRTRDQISIAGSVSTGYLDGQPRQAIFAEPETR